MPVPPDLPARPLRTRAPSLIVTGALMIAAGLMLANPYGATDTHWPWQILAKWPWERPEVNWGVWFLTALLAIVLGITGHRRVRAPLLGSLAVLLLVTCGSGQAGLPIKTDNVGWYLGVGILGAGLFLEAEGRHPATARRTSALGGVILLLVLLLSFGPSPSGELQSHLEQIPRDLVRRALGQAIPDAEPDYEIRLFAKAAAMLAAVVGLGTLVGLRGGLVARIGLLLLLLSFLIPTFHSLGVQMSHTVRLANVFETFSEVLINSGLAVSLLLASSGADVARLEEPAP